MENVRIGVSEDKFNSFTTKEKLLFKIITSKGSGTSMDEAKEHTGMSFEEVKRTAENLILKGVPIGINQGSSITFSFYYSAFAEDYNLWIKK